jgi:nucleoside-diphosphate-sugar epimerase
VAAAVTAALERGDLAGEVFNIVEPTTSPYRLFAEQIIEATDSDLQLVQVVEHHLPDDLKLTGALSQHLLMDGSKARRMLQWQHGEPNEVLRRSVEWYLGNPPVDASDDFGPDDMALQAT